MNFYPLNETPVDGFARWNGGTSADMSFDGLGKAATARQGTSLAEMDAVAIAYGLMRRMGYAGADMSMDGQGVGQLAILGTSEAAMHFEMEGRGEAFAIVGGTATLSLDVLLSRGGLLIRGISDAVMELQAEPIGRSAYGVHADATALLQMGADASGHMPPVVKGRGLAESWLYGLAYPHLILHSPGALAEFGLDAEAIGRIATRVHGYAEAELVLEVLRAEARKYAILRGMSDAEMVLDALVRDARAVVLPSAFHPAGDDRIILAPWVSRTVRVQKDIRAMRVPDENLDVRAPAESRIIRVPRENRTIIVRRGSAIFVPNESRTIRVPGDDRLIMV